MTVHCSCSPPLSRKDPRDPKQARPRPATRRSQRESLRHGSARAPGRLRANPHRDRRPGSKAMRPRLRLRPRARGRPLPQKDLRLGARSTPLCLPPRTPWESVLRGLGEQALMRPRSMPLCLPPRTPRASVLRRLGEAPRAPPLLPAALLGHGEMESRLGPPKVRFRKSTPKRQPLLESASPNPS